MNFLKFKLFVIRFVVLTLVVVVFLNIRLQRQQESWAFWLLQMKFITISLLEVTRLCQWEYLDQ
jgi:hypothetical protein